MPTPPAATTADDLFAAFFDLSLMGGIVFAPVLDAAGAVADFTYVRLNPTAQRLLALPECPAHTFLTRFPHALPTGIFAFYRDAYESGEARHDEFNYQYDGLDNYYHLAARRVGGQLLVSFTDTSEQPRTAVEAALRASQAREQAARAEAERQRGEMQRLFEQSPVAMALFRGAAYVIELANEPMAAIWGRPLAEVMNQPVFEVLPYVRNQGFEPIFADVLAQGTPHDLYEVPVTLSQAAASRQGYFNLTYRPQRDAQGQIVGIITSAYEVTEQVLARQQIEQLNQGLEARVRERTHQLSEQQSLLQKILGQVPAAIATLSGPEHRFSFFNDDYQAIVQGRAHLGQTLVEAVPEVVEQGFADLLDQVYATQRPFVSRGVPAQLYDAATGSLSQHYVDLSYQALLDEQGQSAGILAFVLDVTDRVLARRQADTMQAAMLAVTQRQVQRREELYQVFEQAPAAIVLLREPDHRIEYVNPTYQQFFPALALRGRLLVEAHPDIVASGVLARIDRVYATGEPYEGQEQPVELVPTPGQPAQTHYFNFTYQPYREEGRIVGVSIFAYDVTEPVLARRAAAHELEQQRGELQRVFEQAPMAITIMRGPELLIESANAAISAIWGRPASQTVGRPYFEAVPDTAGQGFEEILASVLRTGESFFLNETPAMLDRAHTGRPAVGYFNFVFQALRGLDETAAPTGLLAVGIEVTDQVLARQQVEQLNQELETRVQQRTHEVQAAQAATERERSRLQALLAQAPVAIALFEGTETRIASANEQMAALWGRVPGQVVGRPLLEALPELKGQGFEEMIQRVLATRVPYVGTEAPATILQNGEMVTRYYNFICQPIYDAQNELIGVLNVGTEVTEQVLARQQIEQLNEQLETRVRERTRQLSEQQALLRQILGQVPAAIATLSGPEHHYTFFNELYQELSASRSALGSTVAEVFPEVVAQGFVGLLDQVYATGEPFVGTGVSAQLYDARTGQPRQYYVDFIYQPLFDGQRRVQGILAFILDVTDRTLAQQQIAESQRQVQVLNQELGATNQALTATNGELHESNRQLTRTNTDLDAFVYTASHDLKAPITNIAGLLSTLREYLPADAATDPGAMVPRLLGMMDGAVARFLQTIGHLTDVSRLQHAAQEPAEAVDLAALIEDVRLDLAPLLAAAPTQLLVDVAACPVVYFSPKNLRSIVYNLLSNALKYRDPARPLVVRLRTYRQAGQVVLEVQDNGLGLTETQQARLFGLFQRLHTHVEGTGVGLYMLKKIVENAGGTIAVQSHPGEGSTFTVMLPTP